MLNNANGASVWTQLVQITALTTILGRLPGPGAQRWEESPVPGEHRRWRRGAGKCGAWGAGARAGRASGPFASHPGGHPRAGRSRRDRGGDQRPWLGDARAQLAASPVTCARDPRRDRDSGPRLLGKAEPAERRPGGGGRNRDSPGGVWVERAASGRRERETPACATQTFPGAPARRHRGSRARSCFGY